MYKLQDFMQDFPDDDTCIRFIFEAKYKNVTCDKCGRKNSYHRDRGIPRYTCTCGQSSITPYTGTLFSRTKLYAKDWFSFLFHFSYEKTASPIELSRMTGISFRGAQAIIKKIRDLIVKSDMPPLHVRDMARMKKAISANHNVIRYESLYMAEMQFKELHQEDTFFHLLALAIDIPYENLPATPNHQ